MYMRMSLARLKPRMGDAWRRMVDGYDPLMRQWPGFVAVTYYCDDEAGLAGLLSVWQSKEAAEAAATRMDDKTHEIIGVDVPGHTHRPGAAGLRAGRVTDPSHYA